MTKWMRWKPHAFRSLPKMSKVFVPASAACQRLFGVGKDDFSAKWNRLSDKTVWETAQSSFPNTVCRTQLTAVRVPLSCSTCALQTSPTNHPTAIAEPSSLMTLLSSASSGTWTTAANKTTSRSTPGRPKSCWWISYNPAHRWISRERTLWCLHLTSGSLPEQ